MKVVIVVVAVVVVVIAVVLLAIGEESCRKLVVKSIAEKLENNSGGEHW